MLGPCPTLKWGWASSDQALDISTLYLLADLALRSSVFLLDLCWRLRFIFISMLPFYSAIYSLSLSLHLSSSLFILCSRPTPVPCPATCYRRVSHNRNTICLTRPCLQPSRCPQNIAPRCLQSVGPPSPCQRYSLKLRVSPSLYLGPIR